MAANTSPIFSRLGDIQWGIVTSANTAKDGTGTVQTIFTADATNGGFVDQIRLQAAGSNTQTVMRFFVNNGSSNGTATNNSFVGEIGLPATVLSETQPVHGEIVIPVGVAMPAGYKINMTISTSVSAGWAATVIGGKY